MTRRDVTIRSGATWSQVLNVRLPDHDIIRLSDFLGTPNESDIVYTTYAGSGSAPNDRDDVIERWVLIGEDGAGRKLRRHHYSSDPDELLANFDALYLCERRSSTSGAELRFVLVDISTSDRGGRGSLTMLTRESNFSELYTELGLGGTGGSVWRGASAEDARPYREFDHSKYSFEEGFLEGLVANTVGFLEGKVAARLRAWEQPAKSGVLLYGPPGNGKTVLTRVCAKHALNAGLNVTLIEGTGKRSRYSYDRDSMGLGDELRMAASRGPGLLLLEDIDLHCRSRVLDPTDAAKAQSNPGLVDLLDFMDGLEPTDGFVLLASTNHLELIDGALLRPGRFDIVQAVGPPSPAMRRKALSGLLLPGPTPPPDVAAASAMLDGVSYAELAEVARRYKISAARAPDEGTLDLAALLEAAAQSLIAERYLKSQDLDIKGPDDH